jgi:hypothetical protein
VGAVVVVVADVVVGALVDIDAVVVTDVVAGALVDVDVVVVAADVVVGGAGGGLGLWVANMAATTAIITTTTTIAIAVVLEIPSAM